MSSEDAIDAAAQPDSGEHLGQVAGKRQRKSVDFFAPPTIHTTEKLAVQQVHAVAEQGLVQHRSTMQSYAVQRLADTSSHGASDWEGDTLDTSRDDNSSCSDAP